MVNSKGVTVTGTSTGLLIVPLLPDTTTPYCPVARLLGTGTVRVTLTLLPAVSVTLGALSVSCGKLEGDAFSVILPANPLRLLTLIVVVDKPPCGMVSEEGVAVRL